MPYINLTFHEKLLKYFDGIKDLKPKKLLDNSTEINLRRNIERLDELAKTYKQTIDNLQNISDEYNSICKKTRLLMRKLRPINIREINRRY